MPVSKMTGKTTHKSASEIFLTRDHFAQNSVWQKCVADMTFPTRAIAISHEEARALQKFCERTRQVRELHELQKGESRAPKQEHRAPTLQEQGRGPVLQKLEQRIQEAIQWGSGSADSFIRLDSRSPKDGVHEHAAMRTAPTPTKRGL